MARSAAIIEKQKREIAGYLAQMEDEWPASIKPRSHTYEMVKFTASKRYGGCKNCALSIQSLPLYSVIAISLLLSPKDWTIIEADEALLGFTGGIFQRPHFRDLEKKWIRYYSNIQDEQLAKLFLTDCWTWQQKPEPSQRAHPAPPPGDLAPLPAVVVDTSVRRTLPTANNQIGGPDTISDPARQPLLDITMPGIPDASRLLESRVEETARGGGSGKEREHREVPPRGISPSLQPLLRPTNQGGVPAPGGHASKRSRVDAAPNDANTLPLQKELAKRARSATRSDENPQLVVSTARSSALTQDQTHDTGGSTSSYLQLALSTASLSTTPGQVESAVRSDAARQIKSFSGSALDSIVEDSKKFAYYLLSFFNSQKTNFIDGFCFHEGHVDGIRKVFNAALCNSLAVGKPPYAVFASPPMNYEFFFCFRLAGQVKMGDLALHCVRNQGINIISRIFTVGYKGDSIMVIGHGFKNGMILAAEILRR
ncbi:hypothetical protein SPI_06437 [Niveomyces insectorum RCEF 264]|uniref:Uncharacterized protein n=1 Tax=Niveomyces insectorum RCEF 264 TaxID=1081102 RepID=A0A167S4N5_9HYPO|nr:hypothetical protein SPI_06437 [Niveomyces insectorum RCEF 264]